MKGKLNYEQWLETIIGAFDDLFEAIPDADTLRDLLGPMADEFELTPEEFIEIGQRIRESAKRERRKLGQ
jgi:hypothetical protein